MLGKDIEYINLLNCSREVSEYIQGSLEYKIRQGKKIVVVYDNNGIELALHNLSDKERKYVLSEIQKDFNKVEKMMRHIK